MKFISKYQTYINASLLHTKKTLFVVFGRTFRMPPHYRKIRYWRYFSCYKTPGQTEIIFFANAFRHNGGRGGINGATSSPRYNTAMMLQGLQEGWFLPWCRKTLASRTAIRLVMVDFPCGNPGKNASSPCCHRACSKSVTSFSRCHCKMFRTFTATFFVCIGKLDSNLYDRLVMVWGIFGVENIHSL